ncbi:MAG: helix-turn-helix domain-containing protein [Solirubrobacteraceae bacterium]
MAYGPCVCNQTVYRLCQKGALVHVRILDSIRIRPADLAAFLAAQSSNPKIWRDVDAEVPLRGVLIRHHVPRSATCGHRK